MKSEQKTGQGRTQTRRKTPPSGNSSDPRRKRPSSASGGERKTRTSGSQQAASQRKRPARNGRTAPKNDRRGRAARPQAPTPEVVYTPARPLSRNRLLLQLITVVAVVLAVTFAVSLFFKVETITVSGTSVYDPWVIREASGIREGDGLLTFSKAKAAGMIKTELPYVEKVMIGIKLPNTVNIMVEESDVAYAVSAEDGSWWLINAEGRILEQTTSEETKDLPVVEGLTLSKPVAGEQAVPKSADHTDAFGETIAVALTEEERLDILLEILQGLEMNGVIGTVASINVSDHNNLELQYGDRFQVKLGGKNQIPMKIEAMVAAAEQLKSYETGVLDVSFTTWPNEVGFMPAE